MSTYSSGYVSRLKAANGFVFSIKQSNDIEKKRHIAEDLSPLHHRLRRSNHSALHQFEHYMYCHWYLVCRTEQSVALCCCLNCLSCGLSFVLAIWCCFVNDIRLLLQRKRAKYGIYYFRSPVTIQITAVY